MIRKSIALLAATSMLSACYSFRGPEPILDRGNVVHADNFGPRTGYLYERFRQATLVASGCPSETVDTADPVCLTLAPTEDQIDEFMRSGYALIYADCTAYFAHMGRNQGRSQLGRDLIGPIGALITGIISVVRFENSNTRDDLLAVLALGTTTATSALNVYDQHFLFGADNIDAVRELVLDAVSAHAARTLRADVAHGTFGQAANHLDDNQALCRPSHILTLVRQAIAAHKIEATPASQPQANGGAGQQGQQTPQPAANGRSLSPPPPPTPAIERVRVRVQPQ